MERYTVEEVAEIYKVKNETVRRWIKQGRLPATKLPKGYRITESQLSEFEKRFKGD